MPLVDGIKMACASCIRGHRSQRCEHHDRPLLKLRKKGRPTTSQCDRCRDLRKALGIHERCICEPDASEAPKRKEMVKKAEVETVLGRPERGSNSTPALVNRLPSLPLTPSSRILSDTASSIPFGAPNLLGNEVSQTLSLVNPSAPARCTSGSDRCCTRPPASLDANRNGEESNAPVESVHPTQSSYLADGLMPYPSQTRSYLYNAYPEAMQTPSTSYREPPKAFDIHHNILPQAQAPDLGPTFDSETLALWDRFLGEEHGTGEAASTKGAANMPNPFEDLLTLPAPTKSCPPESCCETCMADGKCCEMSALCTALGCFSLEAGIQHIEERLPVAGEDASLAILPLFQSTIEPDYCHVFSVLGSSHPDRLATGIPAQSGLEAASQGFASTAPCICEESCTCPICNAKSADDMLSWELCEFCVACFFCVDSNTAGLQRESSLLMP